MCADHEVPKSVGGWEIVFEEWSWSAKAIVTIRSWVRLSNARQVYKRALSCQSDALSRAWYSASEIERFEYRHAVTNMFLSSCQLLPTTSHWKDASEPIVIVSRSPAFGTRSSSRRLTNRTSLLEMVSGESFPSRRTRREGV